MFREIREDLPGKLFNAKTFLSYLRPSNPIWWSKVGKIESCDWVFRGHASSDWKLIPSAFRKTESNQLAPLINYFKNLPVYSAGSKRWENLTENEKEYIHVVHAYGQGMFDFLRNCYECGFLDVVSYNTFPEHLKSGEFKSVSDGGFIQCFTEIDKNNPYHRLMRQQYEIAQHYGVPTHLLDWTKSPIYAAHFATNSWLQNQLNSDISIWAMKEFDELGISNYNLNLSLFPPSVVNNTNAKAQIGRFTVIDRLCAREYFLKYGSYPAVEDLFLDAPNNNYQIQKIVLSKEYVPEFRRLLDREGITDAKLKPGFDSIVSTIKSNWKNLNN